MKRGRRSVKEVKKDLQEAFDTCSDSNDLRQRLEELSNELCFGGLTYLWGPALYKRAPRLFRPFILRHFSNFLIGKNWSYKPVEWKGEVANNLEVWLQEVDAADDVELFRRLRAWKYSSDKKALKKWKEEVLTRLRKAKDTQARRTVLSKFETWFQLDEETAIGIYQSAAEVASDFIIRHLPRKYSLFSGEKRKLWKALADIAKKKEDDEFYFRLYREQIPIKEWTRDGVKLCKDIKDADELVTELKRRHPNAWSKDLGDGFCQMLEVRGEEIFPYIIPELRRVLRGWFRDGFDRLMKMAEEKNWLEMWAGLLRNAGRPKEYEKAVLEVLKLSSKDAKRRLFLLAGIGQEWNFGGFGIATMNPLTDKAATEIYKKFPEMLRGPLKAQVSPNRNNTYRELIQLLLRHQDEELLDYLGSRLVTRGGLWGQDKLLKPAEDLAKYYEGMQSDPKRFARRAASVLGQVPPYVFWNYNEIIRKNRLARLMYERSASFYLQDSAALQDLIEAPEIHAQMLAYRALALPKDEARELARANLSLLLGTLLRPLHRRTRLCAFGALKNAAQSEEDARRIVERAREACYLPDKRYPKDELIGLIASLIHRFPGLRREGEEPVVYGAVKA